MATYRLPAIVLAAVLAGPGAAAQGEPRNVLFIIADDLNVALGAYAGSTPRRNYATAKTPNLDRLAAEGVRFDRAYVQNPLCNPSRTSFLSGLRPASTDVHDGQTWPRHRIGDIAMLPEHFDAHGYFTARVGKIAHNRFEHAVSWDVSRYALSREPARRHHGPGVPAGRRSLQRARQHLDRALRARHVARRGARAAGAAHRPAALLARHPRVAEDDP